MAWFRLAKRLTDEEFIERERRSIMLFERIRPWLIAMYVLLLAGIVSLMPAVINFCIAFPGNNPAWIWIGLVSGFVIGVSLGWMFGHCIHMLITLIGFGRTQRLLLTYHDGLREALLRLPSTASERDHSEPVDE